MKNVLFISVCILALSCNRIEPECLLPIDNQPCQIVTIAAGAHGSSMQKPKVCLDSIRATITFLTDLRYSNIDASHEDFMDVSKILGLVDAKGFRTGRSYGPTQAVRLGWQNYLDQDGSHEVRLVAYINRGPSHEIIPLVSPDGRYLDVLLDTAYETVIVAFESKYAVRVLDPESGEIFWAETVRYSHKSCHDLSGPFGGGQQTLAKDTRIQICSNEEWLKGC